MTAAKAKIVQQMAVAAVCAGMLSVAAPMCRAQGQPAHASSSPPEFEVVSIKPNITGRPGNIGALKDGFEADDIALPQLVLSAYGLREEYQVVGLPGWAKSTHYDIAAKVSESDIQAFSKLGYSKWYGMFQPVLADRFGLRYHWEKRILPTYTLTLAKKGSALKDGTPEDSKMIQMGDVHFGAGTIAISADGLLVSRAAPISMLVQNLEGELNRVVVDETGLKGAYDFQMQLPRSSAPAEAATGGMSPRQQVEPGEDIQGSLYQIGLRLVESKTELPVLVVDAIQPPSPN